MADSKRSELIKGGVQKKYITRKLAATLFIIMVAVTSCGPVADTPSPTAEAPKPTEAPTAAPTATPAQTEEEPVMVTISMYGDEAAINRVYTVLEGVTARYPYITVEVQAIADAEWYEKMMTQIAAGTAPDVL